MVNDPIMDVPFYANGATVYENGVAGTATSASIRDFPIYAPDPSSFTAYVGNASKTVSFEKNGYVFSKWNTAADGTGTSFQIGDLIATSMTSYQASAVYAIWKLPPVTYTTNSDELTSIADAIRTKGGTSAALVYPTGFVSAINDITPDPNYVGPGVPRRSSSDLTASGATVTAPAGYYASAASKAVASGSARTPATTITANPTISVSSTGLITASVSGSKSVTPSVSAGYVASGTAGTVTVTGSKTQQLTVYNGAHHQPAPPPATVTISLTNPVNASSFTGGYIYELYSDDISDTGATLATINSPTSTTTVTVSGGIYGIQLYLSGYYPAYLGSGYVTCSGGVSLGDADTGIANFAVTGDGTITVDGFDYYDD